MESGAKLNGECLRHSTKIILGFLDSAKFSRSLSVVQSACLMPLSVRAAFKDSMAMTYVIYKPYNVDETLGNLWIS